MDDLPLTPRMKLYRTVPVREAWENACRWPPDDPESLYRICGPHLLVWEYFRMSEIAPIGSWDVIHLAHPISGELCPVAVSTILYEAQERCLDQLELPIEDAA